MSDRVRVGLFVTCLVDVVRPSVGFASVKLLEDAGCEVIVPENQTCCGQPGYNSGAKKHAQDIARQVIETFEGFDYVVAPSGSCAAMISHHYPELLKEDGDWVKRARSLALKTFELVSFLTDVMKVESVAASFSGSVTYHDSCSGLRELKIQDQPRKLLRSIDGLEIREMKDPDVCCGFGGTFCVKYSDISNKMVTNKMETIEATGADMLLAGDLGCLMNMAGKISRAGKPVEVRHVVEVLAGDLSQPAIAGTESGEG
jgi:L-lactate dehydrogenase complex protein LldE